MYLAAVQAGDPGALNLYAWALLSNLFRVINELYAPLSSYAASFY